MNSELSEVCYIFSTWIETDFWRFWRAWHRAYYVINFESSDWLAGKIINKTLSPVFTVVNVAGRPILPSGDPETLQEKKNTWRKPFYSWPKRQIVILHCLRLFPCYQNYLIIIIINFIRSPSPGAFISHTNPMRVWDNLCAYLFIFRNPRGVWIRAHQSNGQSEQSYCYWAPDFIYWG